MTRPAVGPVLRVLGAALLLAGAAPAAAQEASGATGGSTTLTLAQEEAIDRLLAVLGDDEARAALVASLEAARAGDGAAEDAAAEQEAAAPSVAQRLAAGTAALAAEAAAQAAGAWRELARLPDLRERLAGAPDARRATAALLATILSTVAASLAFEGLAGFAARRLPAPRGTGAVARAGPAALALLLRLGAMAAAWVVGVALATVAYAGDGRPALAQTLYLNAFAALALARLALRALANPDARRGEPALSALDPGAQRVIFRHLAVVAGVVLQGLLFVVPTVRLWAGFAAARPLRTLVVTLAAALALLAVRAVARALDRARAAAARPPDPALEPGTDGASDAAAPRGGVAAGASGLWRRLWPPLAVLYVGYAWLVAVTRPALADAILVEGTGATAAALVLLIVALHLMRQAPRARAPIPPGLARRLPQLPARAGRIAGAASWVAAALLGGAAVVLVAAGWDWADVGALSARSWVRAALWRGASALLVAFAGVVLWTLVASWIDARLDREGGPAGRSRTLLALFRNAFTVAVAVVAGMVALSQLGLDIAPLLAGAGVAGIAIGFGAQTVVRDVITGVFIQLENAIDVGDVVSVANVTGAVEQVTIRSVRLRALDGATYVVPFSAVTTVQNLTRGFAYHVAQLLVGYDGGPEPARAALAEAFDRLMAEPEAADVLGPLEMQGVVEMRDAAMLVRARVRTRPGRQWAVGQRYSEILAGVLRERGVAVVAPAASILLPPGPHPGPVDTPTGPPAGPPGPEPRPRPDVSGLAGGPPPGAP